MSYKSVELEQAYDKLHDNYWDLIEWLHEHAPFALELYKHRNKKTEQQVEHIMRRSS